MRTPAIVAGSEKLDGAGAWSVARGRAKAAIKAIIGTKPSGGA